MVHVLCSLIERNRLVVAAARAEERERQQVQEEIGEVEQHILAIVPSLEASSDQCKEQVSHSVVCLFTDQSWQNSALFFFLRLSVLLPRRQEVMDNLSSQKATLKRIEDGLQSRYPEIPADISRRLREVQLSLQREEEKVPATLYITVLVISIS